MCQVLKDGPLASEDTTFLAPHCPYHSQPSSFLKLSRSLSLLPGAPVWVVQQSSLSMAAHLPQDPLIGIHAMAPTSPVLIFQVLPPSQSVSFLVLLLTMCICLGVVIAEIYNHIAFDIDIICKPGWTHPAKCISRCAYLICRYVSAACLIMVICFMTLKISDCKAPPLAFSLLGMFLWDSVSLLFLLRTMALWGWDRRVTVPLGAYYLLVLVAAIVCVPFYGEGIRIPGTQFCAFETKRDETRSLISTVVYKTIHMMFDLVMLLLTLHRLLDGGLKSIWIKGPSKLKEGLPLTRFLIYQGFHFYVIQLVVDTVFIATYYSVDETSYQVLGTAFEFCIPPIAASAAFREMGKRTQSPATHRTLPNDISSSNNSRINTAVANTQVRFEVKVQRCEEIETIPHVFPLSELDIKEGGMSSESKQPPSPM